MQRAAGASKENNARPKCRDSVCLWEDFCGLDAAKRHFAQQKRGVLFFF